jgi:LysM repeat protein
MVSRQKSLYVLIVLLILVLGLAACERQAPSAETTPVGTADPNAGGGTTGSPQPTTAGTLPAPTAVSQATATVVVQPSPTPGADAGGQQPQPTATPVSDQSGGGVPAATPGTGGQPGQVGTPPPQEVIYTVQPGDNLYRIGLMYGYSWTVLAQYNGIPNPNYIWVGQQIRIPAAGTGTGGQPPSGNYTYYVVQPGDNLFRIGLKYGISWTLIAEANGLTNPNYIVPGQVLKIPV